jgi:hypothetical protein
MHLGKAYKIATYKQTQPAAVVIPIYKTTLTSAEQHSLKQCISVLGANHPIIFATHKSLDISAYKSILPEGFVPLIELFDELYFKDIDGYNKLLLSDTFYSRFIKYKYILIYQLDAFVFKDDLLYWCNKDYDYIGAPWISPWWYNDALNYAYSFEGYFSKLFRKPASKTYSVGNGGFSLRKTKSFCLVTLLFKKKLGNWEKNEDVFWSIFVPLKLSFFKIPGKDVASGFSFEMDAKNLYQLNNGTLPFGCHAWQKADPEFWETHIKPE